MNVIADFSILEAFLSELFIRLLGSNPRPAAAMYSALTSTSAQLAALKAAAASVLRNETEADVFEAIMESFSSAAKNRNKIAHGVWGQSNEIADGVLLCAAEDVRSTQLDFSEYRQKMKDELVSTAPFTFIPEPKISLDKVFVYRRSDFESISKDIQRVIYYTYIFRFILDRDHPDNENAELLNQLLEEPQIQTIVDRLRTRRKSAPEEP